MKIIEYLMQLMDEQAAVKWVQRLLASKFNVILQCRDCTCYKHLMGASKKVLTHNMLKKVRFKESKIQRK
jgi:hypothetical protein